MPTKTDHRLMTTYRVGFAHDYAGLSIGTLVAMDYSNVAFDVAVGAPGPKSLTFNGSDEYINCSGQEVGDGDCTLFARFKSASISASSYIFAEGNSAADNPICGLLLNASGYAAFNYRDDAGTLTTEGKDGALDDNAWHSIAGTYNGTTGAMLIYVDGEVGSAPSTGSVLAATFNTTAIGCHLRSASPTPTAPFSGMIDDCRKWNRVLSGPEILAVHGGARNFTGLVNWYKLGE